MVDSGLFLLIDYSYLDDFILRDLHCTYYFLLFYFIYLFIL